MSVCLFECVEGFEMLVEEKSSRCRSNQTWSVDAPICEKKTCPYDDPNLLLAEENGTVQCTELNRFGSICSVDCNDGFEIFGELETECTREATWSKPLGYCKSKTLGWDLDLSRKFPIFSNFSDQRIYNWIILSKISWEFQDFTINQSRFRNRMCRPFCRRRHSKVLHGQKLFQLFLLVLMRRRFRVS